MKQQLITRRVFALTNIAFTALVLSSFTTVSAAELPTPPDFTAGGKKGDTEDWLLGPTGLRGWMFCTHGERSSYARQILVTAVSKGSPADGSINPNEVILGVDGKPFDTDARIQFAKAITAAETKEGGGVLRLVRWRAGETANVELKLPVLGSYSDQAPYDCPKSKAIFEQGCELIAKDWKMRSGGLTGNLNMMALLASGKEEYRPLLAEYARKLASSTLKLTSDGFHGWNYSYGNLFLAEYVLATGDQEMLAELKRTTMDVVAAQSSYGTWGHGGRMPSGNASGYGAMNQVGLAMTLSMVLAREAGVKDPALDKGIAKSADFLRWYVDKGAIPYGVHPPWTKSHDDNGKSSLAAVIFDLLGDREATSFFARMGTAAYDEREQGHCGNWFNMMWALPGVARCGPLATGAYLKEQSWYYDLARNWQGGFEYQRTQDDGRKAEISGYDMTGSYLLSFGLPRKSLYLLGKKPCTVAPLKLKEVESVIADGRDSYAVNGRNGYNERKTEELLAGLSNWSPMVRKRSAKALAARKDDCLPALLELVAGSDRYGRYGAIEALGFLGARANAAAPKLRSLTKDADPWIQSLACSAISYLGTNEQKASVNDLLIVAASFNAADPRRTVHLDAGLALFCNYSGEGTPSMLNGSIEGVDRNLLYPAVKSLLANDDSVARGAPGVIFDKLSDSDLVELLPFIVKAANEMPPTNEMFADNLYLAAADLLSKNHIREGMQLNVDILLSSRWGMFARGPCFGYLSRYGAHAKVFLPQLRERHKGREITTTEDLPPLVSLQEFIANASKEKTQKENSQ